MIFALSTLIMIFSSLYPPWLWYLVRFIHPDYDIRFIHPDYDIRFIHPDYDIRFIHLIMIFSSLYPPWWWYFNHKDCEQCKS